MEAKIKELLEKVYANETDIDSALAELKFLPFDNLQHTKFDTHRQFRTGIEEVIFGAGKKIDDILEIVSMLRSKNKPVLVTKLQKRKGNILTERFPEGKFFVKSKVFIINDNVDFKGNIAVVSAGTSDIPVAEEAALTAEFLGSRVKKIFDVGIAGIHRLIEYKKELLNANVIIAVAGMDGALPAVAAGIFGKPVVGVPTSVGYGVSFKGVAPLLTMLNSCAPGVVAVNIDNGFGAGVFAHMINREIG